MAAPEFFCGGHRGGKMRFWGGKNQKRCLQRLILSNFPLWGGGKWRGAEPPTGGKSPMPPLMPPLYFDVKVHDFKQANKHKLFQHVQASKIDYKLTKIFQLALGLASMVHYTDTLIEAHWE